MSNLIEKISNTMLTWHAEVTGKTNVNFIPDMQVTNLINELEALFQSELEKKLQTTRLECAAKLANSDQRHMVELEKLVVEADDKAHFIGFKNGKYAATKKVMDLWFTHMISELGYKKATAYKESIQAALTATKEEGSNG